MEVSGLCDDERHLYDHHPDLWGRMLELQAIPGKVSEKFNRTQTFADIDRLFRQEDDQLGRFPRRRSLHLTDYGDDQMPNHVTNQITFGTDDAARAAFQHMLHELRAEDQPLGSIDFNKLIPMPPELKIECGSRTDAGLKLYKKFLRESAAVSAGSLHDPKEQADPEVWALGKQAYQNIQKYGCPTWYEWAIRHWGTKWNAYQCLPLDGRADAMVFLTAWNSVPRLVAAISKKYPNQEITYRWADEDLGHNVGEIVFKNGEQIEVDIPTDGSRAAYEMAAELTGTDLTDCNLFLTADKSTYEYREDPSFSVQKQKKKDGRISRGRERT